MFFLNFQVIDEVDPAVLAEYEAMAQQYEQPQQAAQPRADSYVPASGPAYASPSMLNPVYANARSDLGPGQLEASVLAGAEAYGVAARPVSKLKPFLRSVNFKISFWCLQIFQKPMIFFPRFLS